MWLRLRNGGYINVTTGHKFTINAVGSDYQILFNSDEVARFDTEQEATDALSDYMTTLGVSALEGNI
jgi:hypothetical protein